MHRGALAVALACSCSTAKPTPIPAQAYERGTGVPRDYRKAAAIYAEQCADGCGELAACRSLFDFAVSGRGFVPHVAQVATLAQMCRRNDVLGCAIGELLLGATDHKPFATCADGDRSACDVELMSAYFDGLGMSFEEPPREAEVTARLAHHMTNTASKLCRGGMTKACIDMVQHETYGCEHDCIETVSAERRARGIDPAPLQFAWERVNDACRDGDADACDLIPGRELPPRALCEAGDYRRCAELAAHGDAYAGKIACDDGVGTSCVPPRSGPATAVTVVDAVKDLRKRCDAHEEAACTTLNALRTPPACAAK